MKIIKGSYPPLPDVYSPRLRAVVDTLLVRDTRRRPMAYELLADEWISARAVELGFGEALPHETRALLAARAAADVERPLGASGVATTGPSVSAADLGVGVATDGLGRLVVGDPTGIMSPSATVRISGSGATSGAGAVAEAAARGLSTVRGTFAVGVGHDMAASIAAAAAAESAAADSAATREADEAALALYDRMAKRSDAETTYLPADSGSVAGATLRGTLRAGGLARTLRGVAAATSVAVGGAGGAGGAAAPGSMTRSVVPPPIPHAHALSATVIYRVPDGAATAGAAAAGASATGAALAAPAPAAAPHGSLVARRVRGKRGVAAATAATRKLPLSAEAAAAAAAAAAADAAARAGSRGGSRAGMAGMASPPVAPSLSVSAARLPAAAPPAAASGSLAATATAAAAGATSSPATATDDVVSKLMAAEVAALPDDVPRASTSRRAPSSTSSTSSTSSSSSAAAGAAAAATHGINTAALAAAPKVVPGAQRPSLDLLKSVAAAAEGAAAAVAAGSSAGSAPASAHEESSRRSEHDDHEHDDHDHDDDEHDDVESDPAAAELFAQRQEMVLRVQAILAQCIEELPSELAPRVTAAAERATAGAAAAPAAPASAAMDDLSDIDTRALSAPGNLALYRLQYSLGVLADFDGRLCELGWEVLRR